MLFEGKWLNVTDWQSIVDKHGGLVWRAAYRLLGNGADAADCFQETFISALEVSRRQRVRNFPALLSRLVTTRAVDMLRKRYRNSSFSESAVLDGKPSANPGPVQTAQRRELAEQLRYGFSQLADGEAEVFCLRYLNDFSYRQIAKELGIKRNAAGVMIHRAKSKLAELLESVGSDYEM